MYNVNQLTFDQAGQKINQLGWVERFLEILVASLLLMLVAPLLVLIALLIKATSRGPIIHKTSTITSAGNRLSQYRFRCTYHNQNQINGENLAKEEFRLTWLGRFLRITKLDELPLLISVIRGDMRLMRFRPHFVIRNRHLLFLDFLALSIVPFLALTLRLDGFEWAVQAQKGMILFLAAALPLKLFIFYCSNLYSRHWYYASTADLSVIIASTGLATLILFIGTIFLQPYLTLFDIEIYHSLPIIDGLLTGLAVGSLRLGVRAQSYWYREHQDTLDEQRVLVVGAGDGGTMIAREIQANPQLGFVVSAFVDDDPAKIGSFIRGIPVLGTTQDMPNLVANHNIQQVIMAIPSAPYRRQREIKKLVDGTGVQCLDLPGLYQLLAGKKTVSLFADIDVEQLLGRDPIEIDRAEVATMLQNKTILITGAGGSIGSEICRQVSQFKPAELILLGHGENSIFEIGMELRFAYPDLVTHQVIADIRDKERIDHVVNQYKPNVIFHAAAHKHVPLMEANPHEAMTNNVVGTRNVLAAAEKHQVERFVLISSDKAVNPSNIMGATKRLAELSVLETAQRSGSAYMAVRFGNVLGSRGSVIPVFQRQIATGGPITITHPAMERYFMTIPEAVQLVLQAAVIGQGQDIFLLDMGQQVRIVDLAINLLKQWGLEPERDIPIVYTGIRPGEKLSEELFLNTEQYRRTKHQKLFVVTDETYKMSYKLDQTVTQLTGLSQTMKADQFRRRLQELL